MWIINHWTRSFLFLSAKVGAWHFFLLLFLFFRVPLSTRISCILCLCSFFYYMHSRTLEHIFIPCLSSSSSSSFFFFCTSQPPLSSSPFPISIMFLSFALYVSVLYCLVFIVSLQIIIIIISECAYGCMVHPCMYMCGCMWRAFNLNRRCVSIFYSLESYRTEYSLMHSLSTPLRSLLWTVYFLIYWV